MKMKKNYSFLILFLFCSLFTMAQDKIHKKNGEILEAKVTEVGTTEIKYKIFTDQAGPVYTIEKEQIIKIIYESGRVENYQLSADSTKTKFSIHTEKRAQNVFVELLGQGLLFSANYDTRFSNKRNGIGGRAGIGYISADGSSIITVPVSLNYLLGNGKNFFEVGLGATYVGVESDQIGLFDEDDSAVIGTMSFMYRLQPVGSGFSFRGGLTPVFTSEGFIPYYAGISLGYTF